jgi:Uma2 family endonuclease
MAVASRLTLDEFLHLPDEKPALEYGCGKVVQKPMPVWDHSTIQGFLLVVLSRFLDTTFLGRAVPELRCIFGTPGSERAFVPDISYVAAEHYPEGPYLRTAPDLAIEILSPSQNIAWLLDKAQFYLLNGARLVWVIDPGAGTIAVLAPGEEGRTLTTGETLDGGEVLPGFSVAVDEIFAQTER